MIQCAIMGPPVFYVAKIVNEDVNIAIPDFWLDKDNMCLRPTSKPEEKAKKSRVRNEKKFGNRVLAETWTGFNFQLIISIYNQCNVGSIIKFYLLVSFEEAA